MRPSGAPLCLLGLAVLMIDRGLHSILQSLTLGILAPSRVQCNMENK